jgi:long-chain acyl-CoA synthetase
VGHILRDAGVVAVVCENATQAAKVQEVAGGLDALRHLVLIEPGDARPGPAQADDRDGPTTTTLDRLSAVGVAHAASHRDAFDAAADAVRPDDPASIVYTSGTTGPAKGCVHLHRHWAAVTRSVLEVPDLVPAGDRVILFLPLAHIFARLLQFAATVGDLPLYYAESIRRSRQPARGPPEHPPDRPAGAREDPRRGRGEHRRRRRTAQATRRLGARRGSPGLAPPTGRAAGAAVAPRPARRADRLVFAKIKARLGGEVRYVICGGAPLAKDIIEFFHAVDILILEGYALTESTMALTINRPHRYRFGTVGPALPWWELRLAPDGEIECRGPGVFAGYHGDPAATAATMRDDGWAGDG